MADGEASLACSLCWKNKHQCYRRSPYERCKRCIHKVVDGKNNTASAIERSPPFPVDNVDGKFQDSGWQRPCTIREPGCVFLNTLDLDIRSTASPKDSCPSSVDVSLAFRDRLNYAEIDLEPLEGPIFEQFSSKLRPKSDDSAWISFAVVTGALLQVLCSAYEIRGQVRTFKDGIRVPSQYPEQLLGLDLRRTLAFKVGHNIGTILDAIRTANQNVDHNLLCIYAAASLLQVDIDYFVRSMRNGELSTKIPPGLDGPFLEWLTCVNNELKNRLIEGCGRFSTWPSVIDGNRRRSRRSHDPVTIFMRLRQQVIDSSPPLPQWGQHPAFEVCNPEAIAPQPDTGPAYQRVFDARTPLRTLVPAAVPTTDPGRSSVIDYDPYPQFQIQGPNQFFYDPLNGDMLGDPFVDIGFPQEAVLDNGDTSTHSSSDQSTDMTNNSQALDPRLLLHDRHLDSLYASSKLSHPSAFASEV